MFAQSLLSLLLASSLVLSTNASPHHRHAANAMRKRNLLAQVDKKDIEPPTVRRRSSSKRCSKKPSSTALSATSTSPATSQTAVPTSAPVVPSSSHSSSSVVAASSSAPPTPTVPSGGGGGGVGAGKPANWPTKTQAAATYSATAATASDPMLLGVSDALNNKDNSYFTDTHNGDLTYYGQGLGACGDTYTDATYTAAVSHIMFDGWPGSNGEQNRSPICGPFTPGRQTMNSVSGVFEMSLKSTFGSIMIGGDGLPNCDPVVGVKCHIPLTATITNTNNGKSVTVQIVDRCVGCAEGDIDVTPTAFNAIADAAEGRVPGISWHFNRY